MSKHGSSRIESALVVLIASLAVIVSLTNSTASAQELSFRAMGSATPVGNDGRYGILAISGTASQIGAFEGTRITWKQGQSTLGTVTMTSRNGDSIEFYTEVVFDKQDIQGSGRYVITGGTGKFQGATGSGTFNVGPLKDGARPLSWNGTLND